MEYVIYSKGKRHAYATFTAASLVAGEIFARTGIVVGITEEPAR